MPFSVKCSDAYLIDNGFITTSTIRSEEFNITGPTVGLIVMFVISFGVFTHLFITMLTSEVLGMPCLTQCCQAFLSKFDQ